MDIRTHEPENYNVQDTVTQRRSGSITETGFPTTTAHPTCNDGKTQGLM